MAELTNNQLSPEVVFGLKAGSKSCKLEPASDSTGSSSHIPLCPKCKSKKIWRDGQRAIYSETIQRWLCKNCGFRFSDPAQLEAFRNMMAKLKPQNGESKLIKSKATNYLLAK